MELLWLMMRLAIRGRGVERFVCCSHHLFFFSFSYFFNLNLFILLWQPTPVFLPGESHGRRSLVGCSPWGRKELGTTE